MYTIHDALANFTSHKTIQGDFDMGHYVIVNDFEESVFMDSIITEGSLCASHFIVPAPVETLRFSAATFS